MAKVASGGQPFSISAGQQTPGDMTIVKVIHIPSVVNDTFVLQDGNGKLVLQGKAQTAGAQSYDFPIPGNSVLFPIA
jgi:hypothetical protein